ncbi:energy-coupling factor transporter ATPase [Alteribacillus sp. HJP-4]|uniref:energy-coupling factor transporter ATPase n=1 Tax=Alteribacillus sp. HJP-4 TaxID=2775394 RepID=UPI0035CD3851
MKITFDQVSHTYMERTPFEKQALKNISASFPEASLSAVIGRTGSGKSTLVQHINGLLKPSEGRITVDGQTIDPGSKRKKIKAIRKKVGMVFQYPEHQLFEDTVEKDLLFGPKNIGLDVRRVKKELPDMLALVGLDESFLQRSPFDLSGGQMRRVAIAGVLAMNPEILILDEPTAGLDPRGQEEIKRLFTQWHLEKQTTMIMITHQMEEAASLADNILVMNNGSIVMKGTPASIYEREQELLDLDLDIPEAVRTLKHLEKAYGGTFSSYSLSPEEAAHEFALWNVEGGGRRVHV